MSIPIAILINPPAWLHKTTPTIDPARQISDPKIGPADAPVKIIEYSDYACGKCREWHKSGILDQVLQKYGGQVVFIWRDLPTVSSFSVRAAEAGQCANAQGKFWEYHDYLYENPQGFYDVTLIANARTLGLDWREFGGCLINGEQQQKVRSNSDQAYMDKVSVSPTFLINGKRIVGPASFESLSRAIDEAVQENN